MPLKDIRKALRWTQTELGEKSGYPQYKISRWENAPDTMDLNEVSKVAEALGVPPNALYSNARTYEVRAVKIGGLEPEIYFGSLHLKTKNFEVVYPISESTAGLLEMEFEDQGRPSDIPGQFFSFKTLNNKWVIVNKAHMYAISWERHQQDPDDLPHSTAFYWMLGVNEKLPGFEKLHEFVGHFTKDLEQKDIDDLVRNQVLKDTDGKIFRSRFDDDMGQYFYNLSAFPERINANDLLLSRKIEDQKYSYFPAQRLEILEVPAELMDRKTIDPDEYEILDVPSDEEMDHILDQMR